MGSLQALCRRDFLLAWRNTSSVFNPLAFALVVVVLFPLGIGPEPQTLSLLAPGLIWVVALLACSMAAEGLLKADFQDGALEQLFLSPGSDYGIALSKVLTYWVTAGWPLALLSPLMGVLLALPVEGFLPLLATLWLGTLGLAAIGAIGSALTVGLGSGGVLIALLILPLNIPILIFGVSAVIAATQGLPFLGHIAVLTALVILALVLAPLAIAAAIRIHLE